MSSSSETPSASSTSIIASKKKTVSPEAHAEWTLACAESHRDYDNLAFPGGYESGLKKIRSGDRTAVEYALCFLEVRPYFFRSQYMRKTLKRLLKRAALDSQQTERLQRALDSDQKHRQTKSQK